MPVCHAFDLLTADKPIDAPEVVAVIGGDATLRTWCRQTLVGQDDAEELEGETADWPDVRDQLSTASLFSMGDRRTVVIRGGDALVKRFRTELEAYIAAPSSASRLILEMESLATNTRLYKSVDKRHLAVQCDAPKTVSGRTARTDLTRLREFCLNYLAPRHQCSLQKTAADMLIDLVGEDVGMLDTEIAKLAVNLPPGGEIGAALVRDVVGGWRAKTTWEIIDAAASGNAADALRHLDRLLSSGQRAIALLPQIAWSLRRLGLATAAVQRAERSGRPITLKDALQTAGFRGRPQDLQQAERQLRQLGRERAQRILPWLLEADLKLKGSHSTEGRDRWVLEELFLKLAKQ